MPFTARWMKPEIIILNEVGQKEKDKYHMISIVCGIQNMTQIDLTMVAQTVKNLPATQETWIRSLGWEDRREEGMAAHSSIHAWRIPMDRGAWWAKSKESEATWVAKSQTQLSN